MEWDKLQAERLAVITDLCSRAPGGSLGRTALMKLCYFLQVLKGVPLGYHFTLYSYGPFDSDVLSDLGTAESLGAVHSKVAYYSGGYGYDIRKAERADATLAEAAHFLDKYRAALDWTVAEFGSLGSANLELQSTVVFVDREALRVSEALTLPELARRVGDVKPHFKQSVILENANRLYERGLLQSAKPAIATA
jgi:hypothetical protein